MRGLKDQRATLALLIAVSVLACQTTIREPDVIHVPQGLTTTQVETAIASAIGYSTLRGGGWKVGARGRVLPEDDEQVPVWYVEARNPGSITAGCKKNDHYLKTMIRYNTQEVRVEIIGSKNLLQSKTRIHKNVYKWIADLEFWIQNELGKLLMKNG